MGSYNIPRTWWRSSKTISGGILYDWGVHLLEYSLQLIPSQVTEVAGFAHQGFWASNMPKSHPWKNDCIEDEATAIVRFANGAIINLSISHLQANPATDMLQIVGTRGTYNILWEQWTTRKPGRNGEIIEKTGKHPKDRGDLFYKNVANYLIGQEKLIITPQWARRPIHILDLAVRSAKQGKTLKAKYG